jgi:hypothetical protein
MKYGLLLGLLLGASSAAARTFHIDHPAIVCDRARTFAIRIAP